jgi:hypothetical protein
MRSFELLHEDPKKIDQLVQNIKNLPADIDPRILEKLEDLIDLAINGSKSSTKLTPYTSVSSQLKDIDDTDVKKYYKVMAKLLIGNGLTATEIKNLITKLQNDSLIVMSELESPSSDISKIIPFYNTSPEVAHYFNDMLMFQPGQRIGPGEILFVTHSKNLFKGGKGDLTVISDNREIEVKGGKTAGRFRDDDVKVNVSPYLQKVSDFYKKYDSLISRTGTGYSMQHIVDGITLNPEKQKDIVDDAISAISTLWGSDNKYISNIKDALLNKNAQDALYFHALANLELYFKVKADKMGILFIHAKSSPAKTNYASGLDDLLKITNVSASSAYPITLKSSEAFPKITAVAK